MGADLDHGFLSTDRDAEWDATDRDAVARQATGSVSSQSDICEDGDSGLRAEDVEVATIRNHPSAHAAALPAQTHLRPYVADASLPGTSGAGSRGRDIESAVRGKRSPRRRHPAGEAGIRLPHANCEGCPATNDVQDGDVEDDGVDSTCK